MPDFDKTGPSGAGRMTGGRRGLCTGFGRRGASADAGFLGAGRGWRNRFFSTGLTGWQRPEGFGFGGRRRGAGLGLNPEVEPGTELETLKVRAGHFEKVLDGIRRRIQELESGA